MALYYAGVQPKFVTKKAGGIIRPTKIFRGLERSQLKLYYYADLMQLKGFYPIDLQLVSFINSAKITAKAKHNGSDCSAY